MAPQYDVFANPSHSATAGIPSVVVVQSDLLDALATRLTMPLAVLDVATKAGGLQVAQAALPIAVRVQTAINAASAPAPASENVNG